MNNPPQDWEALFRKLRESAAAAPVPSVNQVAGETPDPFRVLVSTIISLRTKDEVTITASERLFAAAETPEAMLELSPERIAELIYPCGFYKTKSETIQKVSRILLTHSNGKVPDTYEALVALPGVGGKTANLTLGLAFGVPAICVDTHVHRIPNRLGWIRTASVEETESALRMILPREYWIELNSLLVAFGKTVCVPVSPWCGRCPLAAECEKHGITKFRG